MTRISVFESLTLVHLKATTDLKEQDSVECAQPLLTMNQSPISGS